MLLLLRRGRALSVCVSLCNIKRIRWVREVVPNGEGERKVGVEGKNHLPSRSSPTAILTYRALFFFPSLPSAPLLRPPSRIESSRVSSCSPELLRFRVEDRTKNGHRKRLSFLSHQIDLKESIEREKTKNHFVFLSRSACLRPSLPPLTQQEPRRSPESC